MSDQIIVDGDDVTIETTEVITEVISEGVQGPAGPPGPPSGGLSAGNGILVGFDNTVAIDPSIVASQTDLSNALNDSKNYTDAAVTRIVRDCGDYTLDGILFPVAGGSGVGGAIRKGDMFWIKGATEGSNLQGIPINNSDQIRALANSPAQNPFLWGIIEGNLGFTPENNANKVVDLSSPNNTTYLTTLGIYNQLILKADKANVAVAKTFNQTRWTFEDFLMGFGDFTVTNAGAGSSSLTDNTALATSGCVRLVMDGTSGGGTIQLVSAYPVVKKAGLLSRIIFVVDATINTHRVIGYTNAVTGNTQPATGLFLRCASAATNVYNLVATNAGTATTLGSATLPANTVLWLDIEYLTLTSARMVVSDPAGTKYLDHTFTSNTPSGGQKIVIALSSAEYTGITTWVDYIGWGHSRPPEFVTPA